MRRAASKWSRRIAGSVFIALAVAAAPAHRPLDASFSVTVTSNSGNPSGSDFIQGFWIVTPGLSYTMTCTRTPCTVKAEPSSTSFPGGAVTSLQVSVNGGAYQTIPSGGIQILSTAANPLTGTLQFRYQLGWSGTPFTPNGSYLESIKFTLQQS